MTFSFFNMQTSFVLKFNSKKAFMHKNRHDSDGPKGPSIPLS